MNLKIKSSFLLVISILFIFTFCKKDEKSEKPIITLKGTNPLYLGINDNYEEPGYTATDKEDGDISAKVSNTGIPDTKQEGSYIITYIVQDNDGIKVNTTRTVIVKTLSGAQAIYCKTYTVVDNCSKVDYSIKITPYSNDVNYILFNKFVNDKNTYIYGKIYSDGIGQKIEIPQQSSGGYTYKGNGSIAGLSLKINYTKNTNNCNCDFIPQ